MFQKPLNLNLLKMKLMISLQNGFSDILSQWMALPVVLDKYYSKQIASPLFFYRMKELTLFSS